MPKGDSTGATPDAPQPAAVPEFTAQHAPEMHEATPGLLARSWPAPLGGAWSGRTWAAALLAGVLCLGVGIWSTTRTAERPSSSAATVAGRARTDEGSQTPAARALAVAPKVRVAEAKFLDAAEQSYRSGNAALALHKITEHRRNYPSSAYDVERRVLHVQVLCGMSRYREAQRQVLELEAMHANPAALAAVYRACASDAGR